MSNMKEAALGQRSPEPENKVLAGIFAF